METASAGAKLHIATLVARRTRLGAIPYAGAAMDALLAIKLRYAAVLAGCNGLARARLDTELVVTTLADRRIDEDNVIGVAGGSLHLASHQHGVLLAQQQLMTMTIFSLMME